MITDVLIAVFTHRNRKVTHTNRGTNKVVYTGGVLLGLFPLADIVVIFVVVVVLVLMN